jgi:ribosome maturation factor RimP
MELAEKVKKIIQEVLAVQPDVELVDFKIRAQDGNQLISVLLDTEKGILLAQCVRINKLICQKLEETDILLSKYKVEVSSPGIDRILKTKADFQRVCNKNIRLITIEPVLNDSVVVGVLKQVEDDKIFLEISNDNEVQVKLDNIKQARLEIRW